MSVSEPGKIITPWAESGLKNPIPPAANPATGRAGFDQGFSAINMTAKEAGGIPPFGQDFNGIFYEVTKILRYMQAGGQPTFDAALATAIGGYPKGAMVLGDDGVAIYTSRVDGNSSNPNSGGSGWAREDLMLREALRRSYAEAGYLVKGTFKVGQQVSSATDVLIDEATGKGYVHSGPYSHTVGIGETPVSPGWIDRSYVGIGVVNVKNFGAKGDGVTVDTDAVVAAWAAASLLPSPSIYFPAGQYVVKSSTDLLRLVEGMEVYGDGMDASKIIWKPTYTGATHALISGASSGKLKSASIRDIYIRGDHGDGDYNQLSLYPILISQVDNLHIHRVKITHSRVMGIAIRSSFAVTVSGCVVQYCARDGINTADCNYVEVTNNRVEFCDDDAIAGHTQILGVADRGYVITGNIVRFAQGIKLLGARSATISGNLVEFCMGQGICVDSLPPAASPSEGSAAQQGITITGNTIKNCFDRINVDALNSSAPYIVISGKSARAGSLAAIPGRNNPATGEIINPYRYFWTANNGSSVQPIADGHNVVISGNTLVRDIYETEKISDFGMGIFYTRNGPVDPAVVAAAYSEDGIRITFGRLVNLLVSGNVFAGLGRGILLGDTGQLINGLIIGNTFYDIPQGIVVNGANALHNSCRVINNIFDLDPYHTHANRGPNGTFLTLGSPTALLLQNSNGWSLSGNVFKNVCRISDRPLITSIALTGTQIHLAGENSIECDPVAVGFSVGNKGIGDVPRGPGFVLRCVNSDPASADYMNGLNGCPVAASDMPTTGKFVEGHVVRNNSPVVAGSAGSQYVVTGWIRMTTGSGHVLNTDWRAMRSPTGT